MADADLDVLIRQIAKQQNKTLLAAAKTRRAHYVALAAKAKTPETRERFKQLAKDTLEQGTAAARRLQISADNAADSYARSMRMAAEAISAKAASDKAVSDKAQAASAEKAGKKKAPKATDTPAKKPKKASSKKSKKARV
jgi:DNA polymerase III gamma/tau subunit